MWLPLGLPLLSAWRRFGSYSSGFNEADGDAILSALRQRLQQCHRSVDAVTIAGAGEPMDHPLCGGLISPMPGVMWRIWRSAYVLTNGDRLVDPAIRAQLLACHGFMSNGIRPAGGLLARRGPQDGGRSVCVIAWLAAITPTEHGLSHGERWAGNSAATSRSAYIDAISQLKPCESAAHDRRATKCQCPHRPRDP